jgi:hypothetical protein
MLGDDTALSVEQLGHLPLCKPDCLLLKLDIHPDAFRRLIDHNCRFVISCQRFPHDRGVGCFAFHNGFSKRVIRDLLIQGEKLDKNIFPFVRKQDMDSKNKGKCKDKRGLRNQSLWQNRARCFDKLSMTKRICASRMTINFSAAWRSL